MSGFWQRIVGVFLLIAGPVHQGNAQNYRYEAELGTLTGVQVASNVSGFSGSGYVTGFDNEGDAVGVSVSVDQGLYELWIGYRSQYGPKGYSLNVGGAGSAGMFDQSSSFTESYAGQFYLDSPTTSIDLMKSWGYYDVDYFEFRPATVRRALPVNPTLVNPNATPRTQFLMNYLANTYGEQTLFGQQREFSNQNQILSDTYLTRTGGVFPALIGSDLINYSPSRLARGEDPRGESERMIQWAQQSGGVVSLMWHWNAPTDLIDGPNGSGQEWWRGFYTEATTFDLGAALADPGGSRYQLLLRDIDAIAVELTKFRDAQIPVLWRPLHEAQGNSSGAWFWWGDSGPESFKQLYRLMYDRLTDHHGLDNLIWASTLQVGESAWRDWYPGDEYVDVVGVDVYSEAGDPMTTQWGALLEEFDGKKLIALTETGTLPPTEVLDRYGVAWSYFMPWNEQFVASNHTPAEVQAIVGAEEVIDLSELPTMPWRLPASVPGDFDGDGDVDPDDYGVWRSHFGLSTALATAASPADANADGVVDLADYTVWRDNYLALTVPATNRPARNEAQQGNSQQRVAEVPEPHLLALLGLMLGMMSAACAVRR
ncbi:glycosyl hydrolase [Botrimarina hoheduenensis]|uniref:Mannan endo-1,4-beta-mannosidase n=1 Tax=Botrimarina hoheduenensis TaxID=2528000 RepID=A0A5C5VZ83_9BACT|nr:glycosyl hydrolase [Botrimarina hoheduenensis]TWT42772.1 Mannan endo-1,4-beta-mannosidase [Botrimarina hoheduenensis]